jgi:hypothetical protein
MKLILNILSAKSAYSSTVDAIFALPFPSKNFNGETMV